jgi:hypothetical protein
MSARRSAPSTGPSAEQQLRAFLAKFDAPNQADDEIFLEVRSENQRRRENARASS